MTDKGKEKLIIAVISIVLTAALSIPGTLIASKPSLTQNIIQLPDGQTVNADEIAALQSENAALRESLAAQANATPEQAEADRQTEIANNSRKKLADLFLVDSADYEKLDSLFTDSFGNHYTSVHVFKAGNFHNPYAVFNLNKGYSNFSAKLVASPDTGGEFKFVVQVLRNR